MKDQVILADPPWRYGNSTPNRAIENHYPTMAIDEICALRIPSATNSVLFLWATAPLLPEGLRVMLEWGFTYKSCAIWDKEILGMGYWFRGQHELLMVGTKGQFSPPPQPLRVCSVIKCNRGRHSSKPDKVRALIEELYRQGCRCVYCKSDITHSFSVEHRTPLSRNGHNGISNIDLTCLRCNYRKGILTVAEFKSKLKSSKCKS